MTRSVSRPLSKLFWLMVLATLAFVLTWLSPFYPVGAGLTDYAPLHTALEIFAVVIAGAIFAVGWHGRVVAEPGRLALLASGFLGVALLDVAHLLSFAGMPVWVTPSSAGKSIHFWFAARWLAAFSILALVLGTERRTFRRGTEWMVVIAALLGVAILCWLVLWHEDRLPVFFAPGAGLTPGKVALEWLLALVVMAMLWLVWRKRAQATLYDPRSLMAALWLTVLSELCFTLYSDVNDIFNVLGHVYKVLSYGFLYHAIVVGSVKRPYRLLAESQEILQQLTDHISQVFWMASADRQTLLHVSSAYETIWQRSCRSLIESPMSWLDAVHPEDRQRVAQAMAQQERGDYTIDYRIVRPDGTERWIRSKVYPMRNPNGQVVRVVGVADDITDLVRTAAEQEQLHAQLMQAHKMEAIGHLTGGIAHDFNNILGAILGFAELLKKVSAEQPLSPKQERYIGEILTAGNRAKELIMQMLVFSRLSPELQEGPAPTIALQPVAKEVLRLIRSSIPSSIEVNFRLDDAPLNVCIQPVKLHQVLLNLIINARDAITEHGRIDVTAGKQHVAGHCTSCQAAFDGDYVVLSVHDTGKGITDANVLRIFEPFFSTKSAGKSSGMGLSVVHGVVHALGGHVLVSSEIDVGTTMRILLPPAPPTSDAQPPQTAATASMTGEALAAVRILVVDDEHTMASMLGELLTLHGAVVAIHTRPTEALAAFEHNPQGVDLVITDATMPGLSGLDLAKAMLARRPGLPVLLCTGYSEHVNAEIAQRHGIAGFLYKPVRNQQLVDMAVRLVRGA